MNKLFTLLIFSVLGCQSIQAQEYVQTPIGAMYTNQVYYNLSDNNVASLDNQAWDLAFMLGATDASILLNESTDFSFSGPSPELKLYMTYVEDFSSIIDETLLTDSLYNDEISWQKGAFNAVAEPMNPFDFGWGVYNPASHVVEGAWVFALKLRDGSWKKIKINSLAGGIYTMQYADLDGANEVTVTINGADFDSPMAYFSFDTGTATASPSAWDLVFQRYLSPVPAGPGGQVVDYPTIGTLSFPGTEIAEARGVVPADANYDDYAGSMETATDIIGYDWKNYDLDNNMWNIADDLTYFVKTTGAHLYKLTFIDFEGSSTGNIVFEKTDLGAVNVIDNPESNFKEAAVFPNPIVGQYTVTFALKEANKNMEIYLVNALGQKIWTGFANGDAGLNVLNLQAPNVATGYYQLVVGSGNDRWTTSVILE